MDYISDAMASSILLMLVNTNKPPLLLQGKTKCRLVRDLNNDKMQGI